MNTSSNFLCFSYPRKSGNQICCKILGWGFPTGECGIVCPSLLLTITYGGNVSLRWSSRSLRKIIHSKNCTNACQVEKIHLLLLGSWIFYIFALKPDILNEKVSILFHVSVHIKNLCIFEFLCFSMYDFIKNDLKADLCV